LIEIVNDPIEILIKAFNEVYPDEEVSILYDNELEDRNVQYGTIDFDSMEGISIIRINPNNSFPDIVDIMASLLAKAATSSHKEDANWKMAYNIINTKFEQLFDEKFEIEE
jgi:hypothetical protein